MAEVTKFSHEPHVFKKRFKRLTWEVCLHCGLVALRNPLTKFCIDKGCNYEEHPSYQPMLRRKDG